jgi:hypothetical protein
MKKSHLEIEYFMPEGCLVQPFVELGGKKFRLGEFFGFM